MFHHRGADRLDAHRLHRMTVDVPYGYEPSCLVQAEQSPVLHQVVRQKISPMVSEIHRSCGPYTNDLTSYNVGTGTCYISRATQRELHDVTADTKHFPAMHGSQRTASSLHTDEQ